MIEKILSLRPNRAALSRYLDAYINQAHEREQQLALMLVRVQRGGELIALYGHRNTETLMEEIALRLHGVCRAEDRLIRTGDFEIAFILREVLNDGHALLAASKVLRTLSTPFEFDDIVITPTVRIGIATFPDHAGKPETLVQTAESALANAESSKQPFCMYTDNAFDDIASQWELENELVAALHNGEFEIHYQPKINLRSRLPAGAEALLRWRSPKRGMVPPDVFIPIATRSGLLKDITWATLNMALEHAAGWPTRFGPLTLAVNISPALLDDSSLVDRVADAIALWDTKPNRLILEITESAVMSRPEASFATIRALRAKGASVAIDDFGTGYSSLSNFRSIPATELKIDRSFVANMCDSKPDASIVDIIIGLGKTFGLNVAAEGAESMATLNMLASMDCDYAQGYCISHPLPGPSFLEFLNSYVPPAEWSRSTSAKPGARTPRSYRPDRTIEKSH